VGYWKKKLTFLGACNNKKDKILEIEGEAIPDDISHMEDRKSS